MGAPEWQWSTDTHAEMKNWTIKMSWTLRKLVTIFSVGFQLRGISQQRDKKVQIISYMWEGKANMPNTPNFPGNESKTNNSRGL